MPVMKSKSMAIALVIMSIVLMCCKGSQYLIPTDADVSAAQSHWQGENMAQLKQGYTIFNDKCTDCHSIKKPESFTVDAWNKILPSMGMKAQLDSNQYNLVLHYILTKRETVLAGKK
jgi:cytochrome c5